MKILLYQETFNIDFHIGRSYKAYGIYPQKGNCAYIYVIESGSKTEGGQFYLNQDPDYLEQLNSLIDGSDAIQEQDPNIGSSFVIKSLKIEEVNESTNICQLMDKIKEFVIKKDQLIVDVFSIFGLHFDKK